MAAAPHAASAPADPPVTAGAESAAHCNLKRLALAWARGHRLALAATEVRLPRSNFRADVAAATPRALTPRAFTAVFECKASRPDFLRDSAAEGATRAAIARLVPRLAALRRLIAEHRPDLRRGEELFPEFDAYDLRGLRHETHDQLSTELRTAQRRLADGTKFDRLDRWRAASLLYLVAEPGLFTAHEVPDGWGLLVRQGDELQLEVPPCLHETSAAERVALVERIAAVASRHEWRAPGAAPPAVNAPAMSAAAPRSRAGVRAAGPK